MYLSAHQATKKLGISSDTLCRWYKQGKITVKTAPSGTCLYDISSLFLELTFKDVNITSITSITLKGYLLRTCIERHTKRRPRTTEGASPLSFPTYEVLSDIGSGVNFKRPGLKILLERTSRELVSEVVVTHRDRLYRFAFDLLQHIFTLHSARLVVLFDESTSDEHELAEDILTINTVSSVVCKEEEPLAIDENARTGKKRKAKPATNPKATAVRKKATALRRHAQLHITSQSVSESPTETTPK